MKKSILITLLCAGLMLVTPLSSVAQENKISNNIPDMPDDVDDFVAQIRIVVNEILEKYGYIPMVKSLCNMVLNTLDLFGNIIICIFLYILYIPVKSLYYLLWSFGIDSIILLTILLNIAFIMDIYQCP